MDTQYAPGKTALFKRPTRPHLKKPQSLFGRKSRIECEIKLTSMPRPLKSAMANEATQIRSWQNGGFVTRNTSQV